MLDQLLAQRSELLTWLLLNVALSLVSVPLVLIGAWLIGQRRTLFAVIREGQLCFYCTTTIAVFVHYATRAGVAGLPIVIAMFLLTFTTFVYRVAAVYGQAADAGTDRRIGWMSISCAIITTFMVVVARLANGMLG